MISILTTTGTKYAAAKTWRRDRDGAWQKVDFQAGGFFRHREAQVHDIYSLARVIEEISADRQSFVIRGEIKPELVEQELVRRRIHTDQAALWVVPGGGMPHLKRDSTRRPNWRQTSGFMVGLFSQLAPASVGAFL